MSYFSFEFERTLGFPYLYCVVRATVEPVLKRKAHVLYVYGILINKCYTLQSAYTKNKMLYQSWRNRDVYIFKKCYCLNNNLFLVS